MPSPTLDFARAGGTPTAAGLGEDVGGGELGGAGDAEVDDAGAVLGEHHVGRLQVPVDDSGAVDVAQGLGEAGGQAPQAGQRERAVLTDVRAEVGARDVERGHPGVRGVGVHDGGGEGAADPAGGGDLAAETGAELVVVGVLAVHDLDREAPAGGGAGQVDHAHAAGSEAVLGAVAAHLRRVGIAQRHPCTFPPSRTVLWSGRA